MKKIKDNPLKNQADGQPIYEYADHRQVLIFYIEKSEQVKIHNIFNLYIS